MAGRPKKVRFDRDRVAQLDLDHVAEINAELTRIAFNAASQGGLSRTQSDTIKEIRQLLSHQVAIDDARREREEIEEMRELVEQMQKLKEEIHASSEDDSGEKEATH